VIYKNVCCYNWNINTFWIELATDIIENQFDAFTKALWEINKKYNVSNEQQKIHEIEKLNPTRWCFYGKQ
jgi:hypothetical protein